MATVTARPATLTCPWRTNSPTAGPRTPARSSAGLAAAMKIAEAGHAIDLFSVVPVKRSHSVCAQGGINGAVNTKGEGDSTLTVFPRAGAIERVVTESSANRI